MRILTSLLIGLVTAVLARELTTLRIRQGMVDQLGWVCGTPLLPYEALSFVVGCGVAVVVARFGDQGIALRLPRE